MAVVDNIARRFMVIFFDNKYMTELAYTTTSDEAKVTDEEAVSELLEEYYFTIEPTLETGHISFSAESEPEKAFNIYETSKKREMAIEEFLTRLSEYLTGTFEIKCVQVKGDGQPDGWIWTIDENGNFNPEYIRL